MKKIISIMLIFAALLLLVACGAEKNDATEENIRVLTLKGPTGMGMAKMINDKTQGYDFQVFNSPDLVKAEILLGEYDIAAVPTNMAAALYQKTAGKLKVAAVNTLGVLYIVENGNTVNSFSDLKGKKIYCTGSKSTPEYIIRYLLEKNGIDPDKDVELDFSFSEHSELAAYIAAGTEAVAMLPEPNVTTTLMTNSSTRVALNLTEEWGKVSETDVMQGCIVVNTEFAEAHPEALAEFLVKYEESVGFVNKNINESAQMIVDAGMLPKLPVAKNAIPRCNIIYVDGAEMKTGLASFLTILYNADPSSVGGKLPDEGFYYEK